MELSGRNERLCYRPMRKPDVPRAGARGGGMRAQLPLILFMNNNHLHIL